MHTRGSNKCMHVCTISGGGFRFSNGFRYNHHHYVSHACICISTCTHVVHSGYNRLTWMKVGILYKKPKLLTAANYNTILDYGFDCGGCF